MKKTLSLFIMLVAVMSVGVMAGSLRGEDANAYIRYEPFQSQGYVKDDGVTYKWNTRLSYEIVSQTATQIKFKSWGYAQVGRDRTLTEVTVIYNEKTGKLTVDVPALPPIIKFV